MRRLSSPVRKLEPEALAQLRDLNRLAKAHEATGEHEASIRTMMARPVDKTTGMIFAPHLALFLLRYGFYTREVFLQTCVELYLERICVASHIPEQINTCTGGAT